VSFMKELQVLTNVNELLTFVKNKRVRLAPTNLGNVECSRVKLLATNIFG